MSATDSLVELRPPCGCFDTETFAPVMARRGDLHDRYSKWLTCERCGMQWCARLLERAGGTVEVEIHVRSKRSA